MMRNELTVLVVEDEKDIRDLMALHLVRKGYQTITSEDGEHALKILDSQKFDLVVLDWMLPGLSGLEICQRLRIETAQDKRKIPILMVTARADTTDIVRGLEAGADDYITKPFEIPVFLARVQSLLRRSEFSLQPKADLLQIENLRLDRASREVCCGELKIELTPSEFKLLESLMDNQGRVLSREQLIKNIQGEGVAVVDRTVDTHVFGLRKKLGSCADFIETIRGVGYRIRN